MKIYVVTQKFLPNPKMNGEEKNIPISWISTWGGNKEF